MRVFYQNTCGKSHDELAAGKARFERARRQGDQQPVFELHWAGITGADHAGGRSARRRLPVPGFLRAQRREPARDVYPTWQTLDQLKAASPTGEVYINGQHDAGVNPKPIARSFIQVSPGPKPDLDWFGVSARRERAGNAEGHAMRRADGNCWQQFRQASDPWMSRSCSWKPIAGPPRR